MISENIKDIITMAKSMPNGESRNSMISRLKDAHAHAIVMERNESTRPRPTLPGEAELPNSACSCPKYPHAIDSHCPLHGNRI